MSDSLENGYSNNNAAAGDDGSLHKSTGSGSERDSLESSSSIVDTLCGYTAACKPKCLQVCANPKAYLFVISLCSIIQGEILIFTMQTLCHTLK